MTPEQQLTAIRDAIQRDPGNRGLARYPHDNLLTATPSDFADACASIAAHPSPTIAVVTGFFIPAATPPAAETDGPPGAIAMARMFRWLGIDCRIITDPFALKAVEAGLKGIGQAGGVALTPTTEAEAAEAVRDLTHLIAIERVGPAADGRCYSARGRDLTEYHRPAELLVRAARERTPPVATIGIGDGGNEIGMGKIPASIIVRNIPNGDRIACRVATDHLIVAGVSNWGGYALAAGVGVLRDIVLPMCWLRPAEEQALLQTMVEQGPLVDGVAGQQTATVDGLTFEAYLEPILDIVRITEGAS